MKGIIKFHLNGRVSPDSTAEIKRYYNPYQSVEITETVSGTTHEGNNQWFKLSSNDYIWGGGVITDPKAIQYIEENSLLLHHGFVDVHCHPAYRTISKLRTKNQPINNSIGPWEFADVNTNKMAKGFRAHKYNQSDFGHLRIGDVKVVFVALYPFEQTFISGVQYEGDIPVYNNVSVEQPTEIKRKWLKKLGSNMSDARFDYVMNPDYDYFEELLFEYNFMKQYSGVDSGKVYVDVDYNNDGRIRNKEKDLETQGRYFLLSNGAEHSDKYKGIDDFEELKQGEVICVMTIEGMHSLSMKNEREDIISSSYEELRKRIELVKTWKPDIFYITYAHHFIPFVIWIKPKLT